MGAGASVTCWKPGLEVCSTCDALEMTFFFFVEIAHILESSMLRGSFACRTGEPVNCKRIVILSSGQELNYHAGNTVVAISQSPSHQNRW